MKHPLTSKERRGLLAVAAAALLCIASGPVMRHCSHPSSPASGVKANDNLSFSESPDTLADTIVRTNENTIDGSNTDIAAGSNIDTIADSVANPEPSSKSRKRSSTSKKKNTSISKKTTSKHIPTRHPLEQPVR